MDRDDIFWILFWVIILSFFYGMGQTVANYHIAKQTQYLENGYEKVVITGVVGSRWELKKPTK